MISHKSQFILHFRVFLYLLSHIIMYTKSTYVWNVHIMCSMWHQHFRYFWFIWLRFQHMIHWQKW